MKKRILIVAMAAAISSLSAIPINSIADSNLNSNLNSNFNALGSDSNSTSRSQSTGIVGNVGNGQAYSGSRSASRSGATSFSGGSSSGASSFSGGSSSGASAVGGNYVAPGGTLNNNYYDPNAATGKAGDAITSQQNVNYSGGTNSTQNQNIRYSGSQTQNQNIRYSGGSTNTVHYSGEYAVKNVPAVAAPALTTTLTETCMGSTSIGGAGVGFGFSIGTTWRDTACVRRLDARQMSALGYNLAAKEMMCDSSAVAGAFKRAGRPCYNDLPNSEKRPEDRTPTAVSAAVAPIPVPVAAPVRTAPVHTAQVTDPCANIQNTRKWAACEHRELACPDCK